MTKCFTTGTVLNKQMKASNSGMSILELEVTEKYRQQRNGEWQDAYQTIPFTAFGSQAEAYNAIVSEGSEVFIEGKVKPRVWKDRDGMDHIALDSISIVDLQVYGISKQEPKPAELYASDVPF